MKDDVRKYIYGAIGVFLVGVLVWVGIVYVNACGFTLSCNRGQLAVARTPVPTLIPATLPAVVVESLGPVQADTCYVAAADLMGAWVDAGSSDTEVFQFADANGQECEATFEDVKPLFVEANLWYSSESLSCISCHSVDLKVSPAQLDLSSYEGILAGSRREEGAAKGTDILGGGKWTSSLLYQFLTEAKSDVPGHTEVLADIMIYAGKPLPVQATPTP